METHKLALLRKKLEALSYKEPLDAGSAALVDRIVADLLHTTDSYRDLKLQVAHKTQDLEDHRNQVALLDQVSFCGQASISSQQLTHHADRGAEKRCSPHFSRE